METILGVPIWWGSKCDFLDIVDGWIKKGENKKTVATVNPEFVMRALSDKNFAETLKKIDLNVADGIGLVWAKKISDLRCQMSVKNTIWNNLRIGFRVGVEILAGKRRNEVLPGSELILDMCKLAAERGYKVMLLGGYGDRAKRAARNLQLSIFNFQKKTKNNKELQIESCKGRPNVSDLEVVRLINKFKPDMLFVAYGMGKQEEWIMENKERLNFGVAMGVGRTFDYYSGDLKRAPEWMRRSGFEWLYSLIKEPKRAKRQSVLPKFIWKVLTSN